MSQRNLKNIIATLIGVILFLQSTFAAPTDWSVAMVESTIKRYPTAESLKGWGYAKSLYLYGQYLVYLRTKDKRYLDHIKSWIDLHIDACGRGRELDCFLGCSHQHCWTFFHDKFLPH